MKYLIYILSTLFFLHSCSQVENIEIKFYPAFIVNSTLRINSDSIELSIEDLNFKEAMIINQSDYKKIVKFLKKYDYVHDDIFGEDGITVCGSVLFDGVKREFEFWSPTKHSNDSKLSHLLLSIAEKNFTKPTTLDYLYCLSEYFSFSINHYCDSCEIFNYSDTFLPYEVKMITSDNDTTQIEVHFICDTMPEFPGGIDALKEYLNESLASSEIVLNDSEETRVYVSFLILKSGKLANIEMIRNINPETDKEIIKIIESMPTWKPGIIDGKPVNVKCAIPITINK